MSSVEVEYQALRDKLNEQDGTFKNELLSFLEEAARASEPLTEEGGGRIQGVCEGFLWR